MRETLHDKLLRGAKPIGTFSGLCSAPAVECLGRTGLDYIIIDCEHSPADAETAVSLVRAAENTGLCPLARVSGVTRSDILKLLDVGVQGLIIPNVTSADEVRQAVEYAKFPPLGHRGFCPTRKDGWGYDLPGRTVAQQMDACNRAVMVLPQCETAQALACIDEIADIDGVDGVFVGPFDLSIAMGLPGEFTHPDFQEALRRILTACHSRGKHCFLFTGDGEGVVRGFADGFDAMTLSIDTLLLISSVRDRVTDLRGRI